jgi:Asp-tRNA(Asn)/Glu-tRNA(Gln) amidotransferase A subunit family amidase
MTHSLIPQAGSLELLGAEALRNRIAAGDLTARDLVETLLDRIARIDPVVRAWAWLDPEHVRAQASSLDAWQKAGRPLGPLHGVPVGLKDIIDTRGIPTEYGCAATLGRVPANDATIVERLYSAGAVLMGKTVTTELAFMHPGPTRNPWNPDHTPGGSSSGSAAAVAAGMVPLAVGTQTGGSVTRPAAFCGIVGFKPSFGRVPRRGILMQSPSLDTVGVFAREVRDAALLVDVIGGPDPVDPARHSLRATSLRSALEDVTDRPFRLALVRLPDVAEAHYEELRTYLQGLSVDQVDIRERSLPAEFSQVAAWRERVNFAEMAHHYASLAAQDGRALSPETRNAMEKGGALAATAYLEACDAMARTRAALASAFSDCDAILSTATAGRAPVGLSTTGTAICNGLWTFTGVPAVNVPIDAARIDGLSVSVQVTACHGSDAVALRVAERLHRLLDQMSSSRREERAPGFRPEAPTGH